MRRVLIMLLLAIPTSALAQKERADIRSGNKQYKSGKYIEAEVEYKRALEKKMNSYEANFNLGNALYKQGRNEDAAASYAKVVEDASNPENQAKALYNLGNSLVKQRKLDEAIESYKNSLRLNPKDQQAKFNLAYAQKLKEEDDKKNDKDQDKNQDKNQNQDQNQDPKQDPNKDPDKDNKDNDKKDQPQNQPPPSKSESDRMLNAVQAADDKTKEKVDKQKAQAVGQRGGKQW